MNATIQQTSSTGILLLTRTLLEEYRRAGIALAIRAMGMVIIEPSVTPDLARDTIHSIDLDGFLLGWDSLIKNWRRNNG